MSRRLRAVFLLFALGLAWMSPPAVQASVKLSPEELDWIKQHPRLRVGVVKDLIPFESLSDGTLHGLSAHYLDAISNMTGLAFTYVPGSSTDVRVKMLVDGEVDLLSSYLQHLGAPPRDVLAVPPYHVSSMIIVTRVNSPGILEIQQLAGKVVAIPDVDRYEELFRDQGINARLVRSSSSLEMLTLLKDGQVDAAVASETFLMPYLYRQFQGVLQTSGVVSSQQLDVGMAVRTDQAMLFSILDKSLASITTQQRQAIYADWFHELKLDTPSIGSITHHYYHVLILAGLLLATLFVLVYQSQRQRRRAVRNEQEKTLFLAVMSHEIRSPMNAVLAAVELLGHTRLNAQQRHFTQLANSGANTLLRLLDDVLDVSRLEAGQMRLDLEPTHLLALVQGVVDLHGLRAREKHLELKVGSAQELPVLLLDGTRLAQIFHNLISNAIKFTDAGSIEIRLQLIAQEGSPGEQRLRIEVRDTGIGISASVQASLFRPYAQARHSYKRSGGTGLGLVICRQLVGLMHGTLELDSEPGCGTRVVISLPAVPVTEHCPASASDNLPPLMEGATQGGLLILVVEDTLANQEVLRAQISGFGCWPVVAGDAAQARALFIERAYDLVLMDCDLPDQDGYSLVRELREHEAQQQRVRCPIIAISALTGEQHLERCFDAGMDGVLSKPIRLARLREVIETECHVVLAEPSVASMTPALDLTAVLREMARDLGNLVRAMALRDRSPALHAAHRLHGAALIMEWQALAEAAQTLEELLRVEMPWDHPDEVPALTRLIQHWQVLNDDQPVDALLGDWPKGVAP